MADDQTVTIVIKGKNLSGPEFEAARKQIVGLSDDTKRSETTFRSSFGSMSNVLAALGVSLGATAIVGFARNMLNAADATVKLSDKTGIAIEPLQRLQFIAEQSGNTLEQVSSAVSQLQRRLAGGDDTAAGALRTLGIALEDIVAMTPDQQFIAIAREVAKIEDPMMRAKVATDLFGRAGAELLPTLIAKVDELANKAPVMSDKAVKAFADIGDAIESVWGHSKNLVGEGLGAMIDGFSRLGGVVSALGKGFLLNTLGDKDSVRQSFDEFDRGLRILFDLETELPKVGSVMERLVPAANGVALSWEEIDRVGKELTRTVDEQAKKAADFKKAQDQLFGRDLIAKANDYAAQLGNINNVAQLSKSKKEELRKAVEEALGAYERLGLRAPQKLRDILSATTPLLESTSRFRQALAALPGPLEDSSAEIARIREEGELLSSRTLPEAVAEMEAAEKEALEWARANGAVLAPSIQAVGRTVEEAAEKTSIFGGILDNLGETIVRAFQGGGNVLKSIGGTIGTQLGTNIVKHFGDTFTGLLGSTLGALIPGIGSLLGPALEKVGGFFKSLFGGVSADVQKARTEVAAFQAELAKTATETQRNEAAMSGWGDRGALTLIRVRDALIAIGRSGSEADALVRALWDTDRPDRARRAMEEINRILEAQEQQLRDNEAAVESLTGEMEGLQAELTALRAEGEITWEKMREAANRYGIDLAALGPAFQSGRLHESAQQIFDDFVLLTRGGADVGGVLLGMKDDIIQLAQESVRFGVQIPENFRPLIENLIRSEELTEDEKAALRALGEENFGDPIVAHLDEIATRMGELITRIGEVADMLARNLAGAARDAGREIGRVGDEGRAAAGAIDYEFRARAIPALQDTAEAIEDVIQMQSPTGLEGIIHYARLAGAALFGMAQNGVVDIRQLKRTIDDTAGSVAGLSTILAPLDNSKSALPPLDASKQVPTVDASAFTVGAGAFAPPPTISASPNFMGFINGVQTYDFLGLKPMAEGGRGIVTRPTLFLAGERGPEEYAFSGANRQFESAGATNVYFAIDKDGSGRQVSDAEFFERIQRGANELRFTIPARGIRERAA